MIRDLFDLRVPGIRVDGAVVRATRVGKGFVEGTISAVHGLDQEIAQHLDRHQLSALGVGFPMKPSTLRNVGGRVQHVHLMADGKIKGVSM